MLATFGGLVLSLRDLAVGKSWFGEIPAVGKVIILALGIIVFLYLFLGR